MGLIGGPLLISSAIGQVIGINEQYSAWSAIAVLPIFLWELLLGLWLVFKGFRTARSSHPKPRAGERAGIRRRLTEGPGARLRALTRRSRKSSPDSSHVVMPTHHIGT